MFGGVKNFVVVMLDVDIGNVVNVLMGVVYGLCGECCMVILFVVVIGDEMGDKVVVGLKVEIEKMKVGLGSGVGVDMGLFVMK